jgi:hypothetical protein
LTKKGTDLLVRLEKSFEDASRALSQQQKPAASDKTTGLRTPPLLAEGERRGAGAVRN